MCNLRSGNKRTGICGRILRMESPLENKKELLLGKQEGIAETIIKMSRKGYEAEQISDILDMTAEEVREIIENE